LIHSQIIATDDIGVSVGSDVYIA